MALYLRSAGGTSDYDAGPKILSLARGSLPGRDLATDHTDWKGPIRWSPSGTRALIAERHGAVYLVDLAGTLRKIADGATSSWGWLADDAVGTVRQISLTAGTRTVLQRINLSTGRLDEQEVPNGVVMGDFSPDGRLMVYVEPGPHGPAPALLLDLTSLQTRSLGSGIRPRGWTKDGRLVVLHEDGAHRTAELVDPIDLRMSPMMSSVRDAIASPASTHVVVVDDRGSAWTFQAGVGPQRRAGTISDGELLSVSPAGDVVSYSQRTSRPQSPDNVRTFLLFTARSEVVAACEEGCGDLVLR